MRHATLRGLALAGIVAVASGCGSGGGGSDGGGTKVRTPAASSLAPEEDGFSFANFSSKKTTEEFSTDDLVAMFGAGEEVCTGGTEPCSATPEAAAFARMVNQARASGHCEGLVVLAATRFVRKASPKTSRLDLDAAVTHEILRAFATQFLPETQEETNKWAQKSVPDVIEALQSSLSGDKPEYTLNFYTDSGGHALLPTAVEFPDDKTAVVRLYDSNWPGRTRFATFDLDTQEWSFSFAGQDQANDPDMWKGGKGDVDLTSLTSRASSTCPFCESGTKVRNMTIVIRSVDENFEFVTAGGTISPGSPASGGATLRPLAGPGADPRPGEPRDYLVSIPGTSGEVALRARSEVRIVAMTPRGIAEAYTPRGGSEQPITLSHIAETVTWNSPDPQVSLTLAEGDFVITSQGSNNSLVAGDDGISVTVDGAGGNAVTVAPTKDDPAIEVIGTGADELPEGASYVVTSQETSGLLKVTEVSADGRTKTTKVDGTLANTLTSVSLSAPLAAATEVPGLPPESERSENTVPAVTTTSTVAGTVTATTLAGNDPATNATTRTTVKPRQTTTTAPKQVSRTAVNVGINLDEWPYGANDPASSGFTAVLTVTGSGGESCSTAVCLEGLVIEATSSGTDPATGRTVTTSASFTINSVTVAFSVRCGTSGSWVSASASGGTYSASCSIASVTDDETIYLRA